MVLRRCAWHGLYHSYRVVYGVASWRGQGISFTDGLCARCAILHENLDAHVAGGTPRRGRSVSRVAPELASIALCLMMVVAGVVAARPPDFEMLLGTLAETPLVASPEAPAPPLRVAVRPASEAIQQLFTAKLDIETRETALPDTGRWRPPARPDSPTLAYTPGVARPRALSATVSPAEWEPSPLPSRTLLAFSTDPTALSSLQTP